MCNPPMQCNAGRACAITKNGDAAQENDKRQMSDAETKVKLILFLYLFLLCFRKIMIISNRSIK